MSNDVELPAEWETHEGCLLGWPSDESLWEDALGAVREEVAQLAKGIVAGDEKLFLVVPSEKDEAIARRYLGDLSVNYLKIPFGDIWFRDIAPIFVREKRRNSIHPAVFRFNGWGEKYILPHDAEVARAVAAKFQGISYESNLVLEGGSIEQNGKGVCLTTKQCLLNPNRNPGLTQEQIENELSQKLGFQDFIWLGDGLLNDHTDGHIDTVARFVSERIVIAMEPSDSADPNYQALSQILKQLSTDQRIDDIISIPSPGKVLDPDGEIMAASYVNFYIANSIVIVPQYQSRNDEKALLALQKCFPNRKVRGVSAKNLLEGGGAFHCITQQIPLGAILK